MFLLQERTESEAWDSNQKGKALSELVDNCIGMNVHFVFQGLNTARFILSRHTNYSEFFFRNFLHRQT
jgi:hypothetical protein